MNNVGRKLEVFVIVTIIAVIGIVYAFKQKPVLAPTNSINQTQNSDQSQSSATPNTGTSVKPSDGQVTPEPAPTGVIEYQGVAGKNALELLKLKHTVDLKQYSYGSFVNSIDGIVPDSKHFWAFYINGQFGQVASDKYITKSSDTIKWELDAIVDSTK